MNPTTTCERVAPSPSARAYRWRLVPAECVSSWNERLGSTGASFRQYPFWCESARRVKFRPLYAVCHQGEESHAFVSILTLGPPWMRIGLIEKGPVSLTGDGRIDLPAVEELRRWSRAMGIIFLRFICQPPLGRLLAAAGGREEDGFPLYGGVSLREMLVDLQADEAAMLSGFQSTARYEIRTAQKLGYRLRASTESDDLLKNWSLFENLARRKGITFPRPVGAWMEVLKNAAPLGKASLYLAEYHHKTVQLILVVRDNETAEYMLGATDVESVSRKASPSCLLHWIAMRDALGHGCKHYDLGATNGPLLQFKQKFRPLERRTLQKITLPCRSVSCLMWSRVVLRIMLPVWPATKRAISALLQVRPLL